MIAVLYLLGITGVSIRHGLGMALWSAFLSILAYFGVLTFHGLLVAQFNDALVLSGTFLAIAVLTGSLAQAAQKRAQEYENVVTRSREGMVVLDDHARLHYLNPAMLAMFGYTPAELQGRTLFEFIADRADLKNARALWPRLIHHPVPEQVFPIHLRAKDGSIRILATSLVGLSDLPPRYLGIARDITQQERERIAHERRDRELEAERQVALAVSQGLSLTRVMQLALDQSVSALQADAGTMYLADEAQSELTLAVTHNLPDTYTRQIQRYQFGEGITGHAASERQVLIVSDLKQAPLARVVESDVGIVSKISVPLIAQDRVVGVLNIHGFGARQFTEADVALLRAIASSVALAIDHSRLFESLEQRVQDRTAELRALNQITGTANQSLELDSILNATLAELIDTLHLPGGWIALLDPERQVLTPRAEIGMPSHILHRAQHQRLGEGLAGQILLDKQARVINIQDSDLPARNTILAYGIRSLCGIPLIAAGQIVGVLGLAANRPDHFQAELRWLTTAASAIAIAIRNAQLYASVERQVGQLAALREIDRSLNSTLELAPMLELVLTSIAQIAPYDRAVVYILEGTQMRAIAARGVNAALVPHYIFETRGDQAYAEMARQRKPMVINQLDSTALHWSLIPDLNEVRAWMGVPLIARGSLIGQISLYSHQPNWFTNDQADWMQAFSNHAAVTIANALLRVELNQQARQDSLTRALNHGAFIEELRAACQRAQTQNDPLALIMLDLDNFKDYNDTYGHVIGDKVLQVMVGSIRQHIKRHDVVGRWGGEEFGIVMPKSNCACALRVAERIRQTLAATEILDPRGARIPPPTASQGIAVLGETAFDPDDLIEQADRALYQAKKRGRDQITCAAG